MQWDRPGLLDCAELGLAERHGLGLSALCFKGRGEKIMLSRNTRKFTNQRSAVKQ